ncbi:Uncharacterized protein HZ326_0693 [Fusarium oxysporum f. sp. albedinis]|nr:Uncharacterized protein HZ326_0693 [Fusarium oxysporum f. sp. albedinis]
MRLLDRRRTWVRFMIVCGRSSPDYNSIWRCGCGTRNGKASLVVIRSRPKHPDQEREENFLCPSQANVI